MTDLNNVASRVVLAVLGGFPDPPVDLFAIAEDLGVTDIRGTTFRDGYTDFRYARPVIYLNQHDASARMRFVLAHEVAHIMIRSLQAQPELQRAFVAYRLLRETEERLADRIAALILLPDRWIDGLRRARQSLEGLQSVARMADVTLATLIRRMSSRSIKVGLLHWHRISASWEVTDRPGIPPSLQGHISLPEPWRRPFDSLIEKERVVRVIYTVDGNPVPVMGLALRKDDEVFHLIDPDSDLWLHDRYSLGYTVGRHGRTITMA
jgi:Zn-dependent peptidase ImmA (M78 family)